MFVCGFLVLYNEFFSLREVCLFLLFVFLRKQQCLAVRDLSLVECNKKIYILTATTTIKKHANI